MGRHGQGFTSLAVSVDGFITIETARAAAGDRNIAIMGGGVDLRYRIEK